MISVGRAKPTDDDALSHGTCVASKATGIFNGVSKLSGIIVIKTTLFSSDLLWAFDQILADIRLNKSQKHAVIIFPAMSNERYPDETTLPWVALKPMIQALFNEDAVVVINSGNEAGEPRAERKDVDTLPALWESPQFPLIVAGSVDNHGALTQFSQGPSHVTVWAPGSEVVCAKNRGYGTASGTSFSAGMVRLWSQQTP